MEPLTHRSIDSRLCGELEKLEPGFCQVKLEITQEMAADEHGLAHGGFVFGLADYAAMLAVNHPNVVLGTAQMRFLKPVVVGDILRAEAWLRDREVRKKIVLVDVHRGDEVVARAELACFTPDQHVLAGSPA